MLKKGVTHVCKLFSDFVEVNVLGRPLDEDPDGVLEHGERGDQHNAGKHQRTHRVHYLDTATFSRIPVSAYTRVHTGSTI